MLLSSSSILCYSRPDAAATKGHLVALPCFDALPGFDSCPFSVLEGEGGLDGGLSTDMVPENRLTRRKLTYSADKLTIHDHEL